MVSFEVLTPERLHPVIRAMREADRREVFALRFDDDEARATEEACLLTRFGAIAALDGEPVAAMGAAAITPGVFEVWLVATDRWPSVAHASARWLLTTLKPAMLAAGGHRAQCLSLVERHDAHRFLAGLGFRREARLNGRGRNREDFYLYAWRKPDVRDALQSAETEVHPAANAEP